MEIKDQSMEHKKLAPILSTLHVEVNVNRDIGSFINVDRLNIFSI